MPGSTISGVMRVAQFLSALSVVTVQAPRTSRQAVMVFPCASAPLH